MAHIEDEIDILEDLPKEKIEQAFAHCNGYVKQCPECGELTAFIGPSGINTIDSCHNCGYTTHV